MIPQILPDFSVFLKSLPKVPPRVLVFMEAGSLVAISDVLGGSDITMQVGEYPDRYCLTIHTKKPFNYKKLRKQNGCFAFWLDPTSGDLHTDQAGRDYTIYKGEAA